MTDRPYQQCVIDPHTGKCTVHPTFESRPTSTPPLGGGNWVLGRLEMALDLWCTTIEDKDDVELAIAALSIVDAARRRIDRLQATPPARRHT